MYAEILETELAHASIALSSEQRHALATFCAELSRWNNKLNLTGLHGADLVRRLVVEPVWIGRQLAMSGTLADLGSGNGSPAVPLCVAQSLRQAHLIEARARRCAFLRHIAGVLGLENVVVHRARLEEDLPIEGCDWITVQGVALQADWLPLLRRIAKATANLVWITSVQTAPQPSFFTRSHFDVPFSATRVWLLSLDQS